jgi:hypothetical protein
MILTALEELAWQWPSAPWQRFRLQEGHKFFSFDSVGSTSQCPIIHPLQRQADAGPLVWSGTVPIPGVSASLERRCLALPPG